MPKRSAPSRLHNTGVHSIDSELHRVLDRTPRAPQGQGDEGGHPSVAGGDDRLFEDLQYQTGDAGHGPPRRSNWNVLFAGGVWTFPYEIGRAGGIGSPRGMRGGAQAPQQGQLRADPRCPDVMHGHIRASHTWLSVRPCK